MAGSDLRDRGHGQSADCPGPIHVGSVRLEPAITRTEAEDQSLILLQIMAGSDLTDRTRTGLFLTDRARSRTSVSV